MLIKSGFKHSSTWSLLHVPHLCSVGKNCKCIFGSNLNGFSLLFFHSCRFPAQAYTILVSDKSSSLSSICFLITGTALTQSEHQLSPFSSGVPVNTTKVRFLPSSRSSTSAMNSSYVFVWYKWTIFTKKKLTSITENGEIEKNKPRYRFIE